MVRKRGHQSLGHIWGKHWARSIVDQHLVWRIVRHRFKRIAHRGLPCRTACDAGDVIKPCKRIQRQALASFGYGDYSLLCALFEQPFDRVPHQWLAMIYCKLLGKLTAGAQTLAGSNDNSGKGRGQGGHLCHGGHALKGWTAHAQSTMRCPNFRHCSQNDRYTKPSSLQPDHHR